MKLVIALLLCSLFQAKAVSYAQNVTIHVKNASIADVLEEIGQQTKYDVLFNNLHLKGTKPINLSLDNVPLDQALAASLANESLTYEINNSTVIVYRKERTTTGKELIQQTRIITGTVSDTTQKPIPEVTVRIKEKESQVKTDHQGRYQIIIPDGGLTLVFSAIGYRTQEITLSNRNIVNVALSEIVSNLDEVVVVGYGTQKKVTVTGAVSTVNMKSVQQASTPSLSNAIGGKLPGIITRQSSGEPGYDAAAVYIRGFGTWVTRAPLVLVDGVERDMNQINVQEIESFSVLKDASATAVYGVRGANGVILITTKHGVQGKPKVTFRAENAVLHNLRLPEYINGYEYASLVNEALKNVDLAPRYSEDDLQKFTDGSDPYLHPNVNWIDEIFKTNTSQSIHNLSVNGGNEFVRYYVNAGFTQQSGMYKEDHLNDFNSNPKVKRYNFRSNVDIDLSKSLSVSLGLGAIIQNGHYPGNSAPAIWDALQKTSPITFPVRNPDGSPGGVLAFLGSNPWAMVTQSGYERQDRSTLQGTFSSRWDLSSLVTKGLSVRGLFSFDRYAATHVIRHKDYAVKQYIGKDSNTQEDKYQVYREEQPLGYANNNYGNQALYFEGAINYDRDFDGHRLSGMFLANRREFIDLSAGTSIANIPFRRQGFAGRITYNYQEKYLLEVNAGYNGSENFPKGKRYGFFPSISAGWIVSNEAFWKSTIIDNLKLRGSYGKVGNDAVSGSRFLYLSTVNRATTGYRFGESGQNYYNGFSESQTGYNGLTWETALKANIGLDINLFHNSLTLQIDAFNESRDGILIQRQQIPNFAGYPASVIPYGNLGKVKNKGIESQLEYKHTTANGIYYSFQGTFSFAHNTIVYNDQAPPLFDYLREAGHPIDQPFGYVALGLFQNEAEIANSPKQELADKVRPGDIKYMDLNGDNVINNYDRQAIGFPRTPEIMYGFGGTIAWKGFDVSVFFTGAARSSFFLQGNVIWPFSDNLGSYNVMREYYDNRWTPENPQGTYPLLINGTSPNNYVQSSFWMRNGSYIRLKNAEIGYNLLPNLMKKWKIGSTRLFINGMNLALWDHLKVVDPESNNGTGLYPLQRSYNLGLQINF